MALPKLFDRIFWHNNTTPAINEDNLNAMSKAIDDIDDRVIALGDDVIEVVPQIQAYLDQAEDLVEAMQLLSENPPYIGANGNWFVWDTETSAFVDSGVDASITVDIADITMIAVGDTPYVTNTGTATDPIFHLFLPSAPQGATGNGIASIAKTSTVGLVDTYTITYTNGDTDTFTVTNGRDGSGSGDMTKAVYDSDNAVASSGGIKAFIQSLGYITGLAWSALTNKPFSTIGNGLTVTSDTLSADVTSVNVTESGTATSTTTKDFTISVNGGSAYVIDRQMEYSQTLSTSQDTVYVFMNANILTTSEIDVSTTIYGINPKSVDIPSNGTCNVTFEKQSTAQTMGCRIHIK